jgi:hypothetical protein
MRKDDKIRIVLFWGFTGKGATRVTVDGVERDDQVIPLVDDLQEHSVEVRIPVPDKEQEKLPV